MWSHYSCPLSFSSSRHVNSCEAITAVPSHSPLVDMACEFTWSRYSCPLSLSIFCSQYEHTWPQHSTATLDQTGRGKVLQNWWSIWKSVGLSVNEHDVHKMWVRASADCHMKWSGQKRDAGLCSKFHLHGRMIYWTLRVHERVSLGFKCLCHWGCQH